MFKIRIAFRLMLLAVGTLLSQEAGAATVNTPLTQIVNIYAYTDFGTGDVLFRTASLAPGCDGFWLQPTDVGFKQVLSLLVLAKAAQSDVTVYAYDNQIWSGSSTGHFCRAMMVNVQ